MSIAIKNKMFVAKDVSSQARPFELFNSEYISPDKIKTIKNPLNREFISELIALKTLLKDSKTKK